MWRRGYVFYLVACALLAGSARFAFDAGLTTHRRAEAARRSLFSEHEPFRGDLYPGIAAAFVASITDAALRPSAGPSAAPAHRGRDPHRWSVSCQAPRRVADFARLRDQLDQHLRRHDVAWCTVVTFLGLVPRLVEVHAVAPNPADACLSTALAAPELKTDEAPALAADDPRATEAPFVAFHITTADGSLYLRPRAPAGQQASAIPKSRRFNNTSYYMNTMDGSPESGRLECGATDRDRGFTETRPYIDLAGMGFVSTLCGQLARPGLAFCADVRLPIRDVLAGLQRQAFVDYAIADLLLPDQPDGAVVVQPVSGAGSLPLPQRLRQAIAADFTEAAFTHGVFKVGRGASPSSYAIVLGRLPNGHGYRLLLFRPRMLSVSVGLELLLSGLALTAAAAVLIVAMRRAGRRADEDARRSLQVGLLVTTIDAQLPGAAAFTGSAAVAVGHVVREALERYDDIVRDDAGLPMVVDRARTRTIDHAATKLTSRILHAATAAAATNFNALERIDEANAVARALFGAEVTGHLVGTLPTELVYLPSPDRATFTVTTYAAIQTARANGRASEYFQRGADGSWLRKIGAPIRNPDGTYQTHAIVERASPTVERELDRLTSANEPREERPDA